MITFGGLQCIVDKSIKKIIAEVRPLFCWRCQHFGNKRSSNPSLRVLRIRKGKFLVKNCSLAHIASVHNCLLCCQHLPGLSPSGLPGVPPLCLVFLGSLGSQHHQYLLGSQNELGSHCFQHAFWKRWEPSSSWEPSRY